MGFRVAQFCLIKSKQGMPIIAPCSSAISPTIYVRISKTTAIGFPIAILSILLLFNSTDHVAAQGFNDINAVIKKAPSTGRTELKANGAPEKEAPPQPNVQEKKADSASRPISSNEISGLGKSATVLILIHGAAGLNSMGSGFFISKSLIFTNSHVVADGDRIDVVTSDGVHHDGKIVSISDQKGGKDFAILELKEQRNSPGLRFSTAYDQLMPVFAFGFPYVAISDDPNFSAIAKGDTRALPHIVASSGTIQQVRDNEFNTQVIMHSAKIAGGNSGGPLIDSCGRVVGVNTYTMSERAETQMKDGSMGETKIDSGYAFSISSEEIKSFLDSRGVTASFEKDKCGS